MCVMMDMNKSELMNYHEDTELRLGLSGNSTEVQQSFRINKKRERYDTSNEYLVDDPPIKVQAIGWPPVKSFRRNSIKATKSSQTKGASVYVKVSMDGTPYLRKIDLKSYGSYVELLEVLEDMFKLKYEKQANRSMIDTNGSLYEPTYEDKDGDWMLVGDVPWEMFITSCKRLRIMKGSRTKA